NRITLRDADSFEVLKNAPAPRHDTAQQVTWNLSDIAGKAVFLELVDGDAAGAYAWLAIGRFEPPLLAMPKVTPKLVDERLQAAAQIVLATRDNALESELATALKSQAGVDARASIAATLLALDAQAHLPVCAGILRDAAAPTLLREKVAQAIADSNSSAGREVLVEVLRGAPERQAPKLALALAGSAAGAEAVLTIAEKGQLSARVLQDRAVKARLVASKAKDAEARIAKLTKSLTPLNEELQKQIDRRRAAFIPSSASADRGVAVFEKTCIACHQIEKKGALVGPQLDGIGSRGLERIIEDIVDPNRNVDHAFQTTTFVLSDGDIVSGLLRREEGESIVYAEATGKENTLPRNSVKERHTSELSLMPE
ncbi:MAG TPA: c-type cytochrome, partial [Opitutus sp.]|nr:c-type cytochrome [Opitutus sp.]